MEFVKFFPPTLLNTIQNYDIVIYYSMQFRQKGGRTMAQYSWNPASMSGVFVLPNGVADCLPLASAEQ